MKEAHLTLPELGLIAGTRGALGAGIALLLGSRLDESRRKTVGWSLVAAGALSTIPLAIMAIRSIRDEPSQAEKPESLYAEEPDYGTSSRPAARERTSRQSKKSAKPAGTPLAPGAF